MVLRLVRKWRVIFKEHMLQQMKDFETQLLQLIKEPARLAWR